MQLIRVHGRLQYLANKKMDNSQEITVVHFLLGLAKQLDAIDESRCVSPIHRWTICQATDWDFLACPNSIMPLIVEKRIFPLLAMHLSTHFGLLSV